MRAIILAAGQGTRLLPFTRDNPKCLVPVGGRTILDHQLAALAAGGVDEAIVVGGYRAERIAAHLAATPPPLPVTLLHNPFWPVANSISSVWTARAMLTAPFCLLNGDTIFAATTIARAAAIADGIGLFVEATDDFVADDMLVRVLDGRVLAVGKALADGSASHRSLGLIACRDADAAAAYVAALDETIGADGGYARFHHAVIDRLAWDGAVAAIEAAGDGWIEIDRPEDIARWRAE